MKVLIGTKNPGKIEGAKEAFVMALTSQINEYWKD